MAMLAEPRRKKRSINLRGKNEWSDDQNKFGQKMMQKMGWTPGKGLGLNEDGSVDNVKVRFKDDNGGVGFVDKNDQWTEHESSFEQLLKELHGGEVDKTKLHSETSLEEKSKNLRSRVHYKKFTRGKDITQYSSKDLANIFGKKTLHKPEKKTEELPTEIEKKDDDLKLVAAGSMKDYFQSKLKMKFGNIKPDNQLEKNEEDNDYSDVAFRGFSSDATGICDMENNAEEISSKYIGFNKQSFNDVNSDPIKKIKKKKNVIKDNDLVIVDVVSKSMVCGDSKEVDVIPIIDSGKINKKKTKKSKRKQKIIDDCADVVLSCDIEDVSTKKKSKKKPLVMEDGVANDNIVAVVDLENGSFKRKKRKTIPIVEEQIHDEVVKKKKKKNKECL